MFQQIINLSNGTINDKRDARASKPAHIKRAKRKQSSDGNIFIGMEETSSKAKRIKIVHVKTHNGKGRQKKPINGPDPNKFQITHQSSPKIWDMFERFQNFAQRRVLKRHPSGLLESSVDATTQENLQSNNRMENTERNSDRGCKKLTSEPFLVRDDDEEQIGGDRKRRCVEVHDYEDELSCTGMREPQPASAFKPKCLNFDNVDDL